MRKKKILIATDLFLPKRDGLTVFLSEVIPRIKDKYDITVLAPDYGKINIPGVRIIKFPVTRFRIGDFNIDQPKLGVIKREVEKTDLVFLQFLGPIGVATVLYARKYKKPIMSYMHIIEWEILPASSKRFKRLVRFITKYYARFFYNKCTLLMCPFLELKEILKKHGITRPEQVVVHLGMRTNKFIPPQSKEKAKQDIGIDPRRKVIGYCGRIAREKDLPTLLRAFELLQKTWDNLTLLIVGSGLKSLENKFKNSKNVKFVGFQEDVVPYLQAMDIFVLPSLTETTSLATIEAMACGNAVVVTPNGYLKRYIRDKRNGLFFPKKNSTVLRLKLNWLLKNPQHIQTLAHRARRTVEKRFDWEKTVKDMEYILEQF